MTAPPHPEGGELLSEYAVAQPTKPCEPIMRYAEIDGDYRFILSRRWAAGPLAAWAMLNPSTADGKSDDPTLWRIMGFSYRLGFGGLVVGNRYPYRSPSPAALAQWLTRWESIDSVCATVHNDETCAEHFASADQCFAAWGNSLKDADADLADWLGELDRSAGRTLEWYCFGTNADGSPKHPLARGKSRIPDDMKPIRWPTPTPGGAG